MTAAIFPQYTDTAICLPSSAAGLPNLLQIRLAGIEPAPRLVRLRYSATKLKALTGGNRRRRLLKEKSLIN